MILRTFFLLSLAMCATTSTAQRTWEAPPRLVIGVVVDQMRVDYLYRYWDNFGDGGFKRLIHEGAFLRNAHYTYVPTQTAPGHASIYTGSTPSRHGIVANHPYDRATHRTIYVMTDSAARTIGAGSLRRSPHRLLATTLGDEIERRTDGAGKTIGVALKDRASMLPIGRTGDAAYWMSYSSGEFVTSDWYGMTELPKWVKAFNQRALVPKYLDRKWEPMLPVERYHLALPDDNAYEGSFVANTKATFPYDLSTWKEDPKRMELIKYTPWGNTITTDMAIAALIGEEMGTDVTTDLLAISYGATDELGHYTGVRAMELEDMYIRLDQELERLLIELDQRVGADNYTLFLTADHGAVDVPQYVKDMKGSAGYVDTQSWKPKLDSLYSNELDLFPDRITNRYTVDRIINGHIYLPDSAKSTDYMVRIRNFVKAQPGVADAWLASDLAHGPALGSLGEAVANGYMAGRCGDILYSFLPGHMDTVDEYGGKGSEHFTSWNYDTHVPVIFFGQGIKPGEVVRRTTVSDIAATISMIVGCALPDAAVGDPVPEVLR